MAPVSRRKFLMTSGVANRVVIPVLNSRSGRRLGRRLAVVEYLGRRTGLPHRLVTQYTLDGTTVRINLIVDDPDAIAAQAVSAGASEIFPVADQPYGFRQGRVADPDGHHWLIGKPLDD